MDPGTRRSVAKATTPRQEAEPTCSRRSLSTLDPEELVEYLTESSFTVDNCLSRILWTFGAHLAKVLTPAHVREVADEIEERAEEYHATNDTRIRELAYFQWAAVHHDAQQRSVDVGDAETRASINAAFDAMQANPHTFDVTADAGHILYALTYTLRYAPYRGAQLDLLGAYVTRFSDPDATRHQDGIQRDVMLNVLWVNFLGVTQNDPSFADAVRRTPAYVTALSRVPYNPHLAVYAYEWIVRDTMNEYARLGTLPRMREEIASSLIPMLGDMRSHYGRISVPWLSVASGLENLGRCAPYDACRSDIEAEIFPTTFTFDDKHMVVHTALGKGVIEKLYYASKQVKAQFFRILGTDAPLSKDPNDVLTMRIYESRRQYEIVQTYLYGFGTNNGGLYIEDGATFYTYQRRVPQDSRFTLEELFRHEYTHYLNGRWAVRGFFGEGPWYENGRTTAMDEGMAEYLAGSTRDDGVPLRKTLVQGIIQDVEEYGSYMTVDDVIHATYDMPDFFRFYPYAGALFALLGERHPEMLREMYGYLRSGDVKGWDAFRDRLGRNQALQAEYEAYLDKQVAAYPNQPTPSTTYVPVPELELTALSAVQKEFRASTGHENATCRQAVRDQHPRYTCTGALSVGTDPDDPGQVYQNLDHDVDVGILGKSAGASNNFSDMVCYYSEPSASGMTARSTFTCEGPLATR